MKTLLLILTLLGLGHAFASERDFVLVNQTGRSFEGVYISAADDKDWDGNLLIKGRALAPGGKLTVRFEEKSDAATWDLNLVDDEGLIVRFDKVNLSNVEMITLKDANGKITAVVE